ncbi:MAG: ABC transporter ATP-binding protein [Candidatus Omnitrophica bacterium]|nr:ABC transporter ATP-binding protein [Candidatus Omnitrophota bacterium]
MSLIEIKNLELAYGRPEKFVKAVGPISFSLEKGEAFGLIGESGAGKSTLGLELLGLLGFKGGFRRKGEIITALPFQKMAYIPQDPGAALDPLFSIGSQLRERSNHLGEIEEALRKVHLSLDKISLQSYPHELSGGMKQRVLIAMALLQKPELMVMDEPTSSLDVTLQGEMMALFREIRLLGMTFLFITHNLPLAANFCGRVAIMRSGEIVEMGPAPEVFSKPANPYTQALIDAVPRLEK